MHRCSDSGACCLTWNSAIAASSDRSSFWSFVPPLAGELPSGLATESVGSVLADEGGGGAGLAGGGGGAALDGGVGVGGVGVGVGGGIIRALRRGSTVCPPVRVAAAAGSSL